VGGGNDPAAYGFDLANLAPEARTTLVGSGNPRDFLTAYDMPATIPGTEMVRFNGERRSKYVVTADRVAGVVVNGAARAYPLAVLNGHEVVNDVLGGVPIAVTFSPLTDSVVVFDRRVGGEERLFRVSGLLWNSNLVMYDVPADPARRAGAVASLWSQLGMRAIAGPAAAGPVRATPKMAFGKRVVAVAELLHATHPVPTRDDDDDDEDDDDNDDDTKGVAGKAASVAAETDAEADEPAPRAMPSMPKMVPVKATTFSSTAIRSIRACDGGVRGKARMPMMMVKTPMGALTANSHCQDETARMAEAMVGPKAVAAATTREL
jgi:hypothetical protein